MSELSCERREVVRDNMTENKTTLSNDNFYETRKMKFCVFYYFSSL